jgi:hypothetical protein
VRTFGVLLAFVPLVQVTVEFPRRLTQVRLTDYVVQVKNRSGLVAADRHRHPLWHPGAGQIPDPGSAKIMKEPSRLSGFLIPGPKTCLKTRGLPVSAEVTDPFAVLEEHVLAGRVDPPGSREETGFRRDGSPCSTRKSEPAGIPEEGNFEAEGIPRVQRSLYVDCSLRAWVHRLRVRPWAGYACGRDLERASGRRVPD